MKTEMLNNRKLSEDSMEGMEDMTWFTHARIFDDLLVVAQKKTACYIWKTEAGLVVFDGIWPDERAYKEILSAIKDAGWENCKIIKFVMTHGHINHVGCGKWFSHEGVRTYLSKADDDLRLGSPEKEGWPDSWKDFDIDYHLQDGDVIQCGDKSFTVMSTAGHTDGSMSFFFPVHEDGEEYLAGLFGGSTAQKDDEKAPIILKASVMRFKQFALLNHCEVALTTHVSFDNGLERIAYSRKRTAHLPNIYIVGTEGFQKFFTFSGKQTEKTRLLFRRKIS